MRKLPPHHCRGERVKTLLRSHLTDYHFTNLAGQQLPSTISLKLHLIQDVTLSSV